MMRPMTCSSRRLCAIVWLWTGCAGGETGSTATDFADGSDGTATTLGNTTAATAASTTTTSDASTTELDGSGSSSGGPDVGGGCEPGAVDCPCDAGTCMRGLSCETDVCVPTVQCDDDPNEPNDGFGAATMLGGISDDDSETLPFAGVLDHADDEDWFRYDGSDVLGNTVDPGRTLMVDGGGVELCKFFQCNVGEAQVVCPDGTRGVLESNVHGCCSPSAFSFGDSDVECIGGAFDTGGTVWLVLRNADAQCVGYSGVAHF